jgi:hypothetical protein
MITRSTASVQSSIEKELGLRGMSFWDQVFNENKEKDDESGGLPAENTPKGPGECSGDNYSPKGVTKTWNNFLSTLFRKGA